MSCGAGTGVALAVDSQGDVSLVPSRQVAPACAGTSPEYG